MRAGFRASDLNSILELTDCVSDEDGHGCLVDGRAMLRATRMAVTRSKRSGFVVRERAHAVLNRCSSKACGSHGVCCGDKESKVHAEGCTFQSNGRCGVSAEGDAEVTVEGCHSSQHSIAAGFFAVDRARMKVRCSVSEGDQHGCGVLTGGQLTMEDVTVNGTLQSLPLRDTRELGRPI